MDVKKEVESMVSEFKGEPVELKAATTLEDLGFDSLDSVDFLMQLEDKFGITFEDDFQAANLGELVAKIEELK